LKTVLQRGLLTAALLVIAACSSDRPENFEQRYLAMATWVDVAIDRPRNELPTDLSARIESTLQSYARDYYAWGDGELGRLNEALSEGRNITVSAELAALLTRARELSRIGGGHFDPSVASLVELWGFHSESAQAQVPSAAQINAIRLANPGMSALEIDGLSVGSALPGLKLDLGGIAKGHIVDQLVELLNRAGIDAAMVNAGGDLRVLGRRSDRPWRIGIQAPRSDGLLGVIELQNGEAAFTSGDYERYFESGQERQHHLLDPSTGRPAQHSQAVTVLAADGTTADAAATALFVAGPSDWPEVARALGIRHVLRVDASGRIEVTPAMRDRLQISAGGESDILTIPL
jgi:thiamine biosynthesis lipoprotein